MSTLALLLMGFTPTAYAQGAAAEQGSISGAEQAFLEGRRLLLLGQPGAACERFAASAASYPTAATLLNVANCMEEGHSSGGLLEARSMFERVLVEVERVEDPRARATLRAEARRRLEHLNARLPKLRLRPSPTIEAEVFLNGLRIETSNAAVPVNPGKYRVEMRGGWCRPYFDMFELSVGQTLDLQLPPLRGCRFGRAPVWLGITGGVLAGLWVLTATSAYSANADYGRLYEECVPGPCAPETLSSAREARDTARMYAKAADYVIGPAALAALGTALTLWWLDYGAVRDFNRGRTIEPDGSGGGGAAARLDAGCGREGCSVSATFDL